MAVLGLCFCARAFSSCGERGPLFIAVRGPLTTAASLVAEHRLQTRRLSSCSSRAQLPHGTWDPPRPGLEPVSPASAGRLSTTVPPGKLRPLIFIYLFIYLFIYFLRVGVSIATLFIYFFFYFLAVLGLRFLRGLSLVTASGGHSSSRCVGLSPSRPLPLRGTGSRRAGSVAVAHGPSRSMACGILPDQGSNPCPLH